MGIPMRSPKQYLVVEVSAEGTIEFHPMKNWCRANPSEAPPLNPNEANSQALRRGFERLGWTVEETDTQIRFFKPGTTQSALEVLGEADPDLDQLDTPDGERETVFELELRIPRHLDTQPTIIWTLVPCSLGHLIHVHLDRQSERSDAGLHC